MLYTAHLGSSENLYPCSRGTSKTATIGTQYNMYCALHFPVRNWVVLSATGFRGGQLMFTDTERWLNGSWDSQRMEHPFIAASINRSSKKHFATHRPSMWEFLLDSKTSIATMQTQDEDKLRGQRAKDLIIDEANLLLQEFIEKTTGPFLNVLSDMRHGGEYAAANRLFLLTTLDYTWRPFVKRMDAAKDGMRRDYELYLAKKRGDRTTYFDLHRKGVAQYMLVQFDYVDTLIRRRIETRDGQRFLVNFTDPELPLKKDLNGIPYMFPDSRGRLVRESPPVEYWRTYGIDKPGLERGLFDGTATESTWLAEQRNILDNAAGDVYLNEWVDEAECKGDRCIIPFRKLPEAWQEKYADEELDYAGPVLYRCTDPCVVGVDYAPEKDFCSFVVIRVGFLATGPFNPFSHTGKTSWSNVIWCEQFRRMDFLTMAQKLWDFRERYNLVWFTDPVSDWNLACRAIGLDNRGGGHGLRDVLAGIGSELPQGIRRIYDPKDMDERVQAFTKDSSADPMLDNIKASDILNSSLVDFTIAQFQQKRLYLPKWVDQSRREPGNAEVHHGYAAARQLSDQLRKLRQEPTAQARRFYMEGDTDLVENKKDLWAAFIYASKQLRAHWIRVEQLDQTPPPTVAMKVYVNSRKGRRYGKAAGAKG